MNREIETKEYFNDLNKIKETIRLPIMLVGANPISLNTSPPINPPPIPRRMFFMIPDFSPIR